tara:strand:+ start:244 stop:525 length:282 start_codon:yes stop_codon:yes gene_type:complete
MKQLLYISLIALMCSCSGSQLFLEARTTYDVPLNHDGHINKNVMESDAKNVSGLNQFNPQIRLTYRQYLFDGKKQQMKQIVKKQLQNYNIKHK